VNLDLLVWLEGLAVCGYWWPARHRMPLSVTRRDPRHEPVSLFSVTLGDKLALSGPLHNGRMIWSKSSPAKRH
jgi:hypothetical protein